MISAGNNSVVSSVKPQKRVRFGESSSQLADMGEEAKRARKSPYYDEKIIIDLGVVSSSDIGSQREVDEIRIAANPKAPSMRDFQENIINRFIILDDKFGVQPKAARAAKKLAKEYPILVEQSVCPQRYS